MYKPLITVSFLVLTALGWTQDRRKPVVSLGGGEMIVEWTPGQEAVVRISAESEEELESIQVFHSDGQKLVDLDARNSVQSGLSSLEIELREPTLERLFKNFAEGSYDIRAATVSGKLALGNAKLSFDMPPPPLIVHPQPGQLVKASGLTVSWWSDGDVESYELQVEQGEDDGLRVKLPPALTSFQVPHGFLAPGTETSVEVVAIGANGNRTVAEVLFMTQP